MSRLLSMLPRGQTLPDGAWRTRQRALLLLLWLHAVGIGAFSLAQGHPLLHAFEHTGALAAFALAAHATFHRRRVSSVLLALGLVTSSALLVHVWDGVIEAHFHFFVMVVVLALFEDWLVFLLAAAYVVLHHAGFGVMHPESVYNHPDAIAHPLKWALIHGLFVTAAGLAGVVGWRFNEIARAELREADAGRAATMKIVERQHRLLEEAQALAGIGSWEWDIPTDTVEWSPQLWRIYGLDPDSEPLAFERVVELAHPDDREMFRNSVAAAMETGEHFAFDFRLVRSDGALRFVHARGEVVRGEDGVPVRMHGTAQEVTERKEAERRLTKAHADALEASRMKSEFVANMSHELRTPLNGVIGLSVLLTDTELSEEQREYAEAIRASGDALQAIVDDILDFSKIEAGKLELHWDVFEPEEIVEGVAAMLAPQAHAKGVELIAWVGEDVPAALWGDGPRIRQVLANLASNAVKFTHHGQVVIRVGPHAREDGRPAFRFEVRDTGIGIADDAIARIFESFSQADSSTTRRYGGTGLGLAISRRLVELMGGELGVQSVQGEGSTFWFTVPLDARVSSAGRPAHPALAGARALVADGNATNRLVLCRQLAAWGVEAEMATDGLKALTRLHEAADEQRPFTVALIGFDMPGLDGLSLTRAITHEPALEQLRVLMLGSAGCDRADAWAAGADGVITKPVRRERLGGEIERVLAGRDRDGAAAPAPATAPAPSHGSAVLVAEDNEVNQLVAVRLLQQRGYLVDVAANGVEAVRMHANGGYAAIFMDCQMPELDGYAATAEIRDHEAPGQRTAIIAMTANTMKGDREKCLAAGMDDYLGKPLDPAALDEVLARLVPASDTPVIDPRHLDTVCGDDEELRSKIVGLFIEQTEGALDQISRAIASGTCAEAATHAHRLKGSAAAVGAMRLADVAGRIDVATRAGRIAEAAELEPALGEALQLAVAAVARSVVEQHPLEHRPNGGPGVLRPAAGRLEGA